MTTDLQTKRKAYYKWVKPLGAPLVAADFIFALEAEIARLRKREAAVREYLAECRELGIGAVCEDILAIMDEEGE